MSQRNSEYPRRPDDDYATPPWVVQVIVPYLRQHALHLWDPASGAGQLVHALSAEGFGVVGTGDDFLAKTGLPHDRIDCIVTNPPYGSGGRLACQFVAHAIELAPIVAMLLSVDFDSGKTRTHLFRDCPTFSGKVVLLDRIMWLPGHAGPSTNHAWFIWHRRHCGPPTVSYARKPDANHHCYQPPSSADPLGKHSDPRQLDLFDHAAEEKLRRALEAVSYDGTEVHRVVDRELHGLNTKTQRKKSSARLRRNIAKQSRSTSSPRSSVSPSEVRSNSRVVAAPPGAQPGLIKQTPPNQD